MNIVLALDGNYLRPAKVMLGSLILNNSCPLEIYLFHAGLTLPELESVSVHCAALSDHIGVHFIKVDDSLFDGVPLSFDLPHTAYYRFLTPSILPESAERALYLDCDIIVNRSVAKLYNTNFEGNLFVACEDLGISVLGMYKFLSIFGRLGEELPGGKYFNSGVLLMNLDLARQMVSLDDVNALIGKHPKHITFADQDILNYLYGRHTKYVDYKVYNMGAGYVKPENETWTLKNTALIHYYGEKTDKPWLDKERADKGSAMDRLWWDYANRLEHVPLDS